MPNWCVTNWTVRGKKQDIQAFCDTVNDLVNHPVGPDNFFGDYWLGNLAEQLDIEIDRNHDNIRGTIDVDDSLCATLIFPGTPEERMDKMESVISGDIAVVSFSTVSAWDRPYWLEDYISAHFIDYGFTSTDEFRNFNIVRNTELYPWIYEVHHEDGWEEYKIGEEEKVCEYIAGLLGVEIGPPANYEELLKAIEPYMDQMEEKEISLIVYEIEG